MNTLKGFTHLLRLSGGKCLSVIPVAGFRVTSAPSMKWGTNKYANPYDELQQHLVANVTEELFKPTEEEVKEASEKFHPKKISFIVHKPVVDPHLLPEINLPEVRKVSLNLSLPLSLSLSVCLSNTHTLLSLSLSLSHSV